MNEEVMREIPGFVRSSAHELTCRVHHAAEKQDRAALVVADQEHKLKGDTSPYPSVGLRLQHMSRFSIVSQRKERTDTRVQAKSDS